MNNAAHPIWGFLRLTVMMVSLVVVLYLNASHFDATEIRTIIAMFVVSAGAEGIPQILARFGGNTK